MSDKFLPSDIGKIFTISPVCKNYADTNGNMVWLKGHAGQVVRCIEIEDDDLWTSGKLQAEDGSFGWAWKDEVKETGKSFTLRLL